MSNNNQLHLSKKNSLIKDWMRKESRSHPNHFYYFNIKTGESRWETSPSKNNGEVRKLSTKSVDDETKRSSNVGNDKKKSSISAKSREGMNKNDLSAIVHLSNFKTFPCNFCDCNLNSMH